MPSLRSIALATALAAGLVGGSPALATAPPPAVTTAETPNLGLASTLAETMLDLILTQAAVDRAVGDGVRAMTKNLPSSWGSILGEAIWEEIDAQRPQLDAALARDFAQRFSEGEMRAGLTYLNNPSARAAIRAELARSAGDPQLAISDSDRASIRGALDSADGRGFIAKLKSVDAALKAAMNSNIRVWYPGAMRRFGIKVQAAAPPPAPLTERDRLVIAFAHGLAPADALKPLIETKVVAQLADKIGTQYPAEWGWTGLLNEAGREATDATWDELDRIYGGILCEGFTDEEVRRVDAFLKTPGGHAMTRMVRATLTGGRAKLTPLEIRQLVVFEHSPLGSRVVARSNMKDLGERAGVAWAIYMAPELFKRFGEKAQAAEAARSGAPARPS